jgi:hypothetical protein
MPIHDRPAGERTPSDGQSLSNRYWPVVRCDLESAMIEETNYRVTSTAHTCGILGDCIQNGLEVTGRAADHPKDLGRGRLLLLRLRLPL